MVPTPFLVSKPSGMTEDDAPASAYLRAVPNCSAGFVYTERGKSTKSSSVPINQHVRNVFDPSMCEKSVHEWAMIFPAEIQALANQYERGQTSLCGLFLTTVKEAI